jgi:hypothetical protein
MTTRLWFRFFFRLILWASLVVTLGCDSNQTTPAPTETPVAPKPAGVTEPAKANEKEIVPEAAAEKHSAVGSPGNSVDYQKEADNALWQWVPEHASCAYCLEHCTGGYEIHVSKIYDLAGDVVEFVRNGSVAFGFQPKEDTVFQVVDDVLYYAIGCESVKAHDLKNRKELWSIQLKGLQASKDGQEGPEKIGLTLEVMKGSIRIFGKGRTGRFIEFLDTHSGAAMGHKVFPKE